MRKSVRTAPPEVALDRVLAGLAPELVEASDEDIEQAAAELRMDVKMKGSAAFIGVLHALPKRFDDIFEVPPPRSFLPSVGRKDSDDEET
jgi:hypothetical protein